ncbi:uncharacterized protein BEWA_007020 [Theileria equi strain WA]|uniref:Membrane protein, putative n=1 Tax=Theileria equi strain WA TaxID=1537102 RepID=L0B1A4_THEEQ|nr:uncharacterized protein BEWA_007020 [Theileria equi strain WA]AFZ81293.1 membrane protein, putative [Theileria equi strain WA]|eukprot:XP_004830959.1 uncharacterized protein BEWA_007020 [Theileria equi strain WA]
MPCLIVLPAALSALFFFVGGITAFVRKHSKRSLLLSSVVSAAFAAASYLLVVKPHEYVGFCVALGVSLFAFLLGSCMLYISTGENLLRKRVACLVFSFGLFSSGFYYAFILSKVYALPTSVVYTKIAAE